MKISCNLPVSSEDIFHVLEKTADYVACYDDAHDFTFSVCCAQSDDNEVEFDTTFRKGVKFEKSFYGVDFDSEETDVGDVYACENLENEDFMSTCEDLAREVNAYFCED